MRIPDVTSTCQGTVPDASSRSVSSCILRRDLPSFLHQLHHLGFSSCQLLYEQVTDGTRAPGLLVLHRHTQAEASLPERLGGM